ncbi:MAG: thiamine pyrophosphate-binding protein [Rhodospirillaceae bacterium]|jgi:acetolactate synthase I/II/III large subunit|nr:thiamine pyrophosphate-binding protein [Rhodospirillaceae bacterium]MBT5239727.1 thiamine pyrophosphate-binding protein [Rhodospirillaceae bacterium]MBT5567243.1 thiamine pyrophosphate-binding protein [Rhodospirillaceae bacterium]
MTSSSQKTKASVGRRNFLKTAVVAGASTALPTDSEAATGKKAASDSSSSQGLAAPSAEQMNMEASTPEQLAEAQPDQLAANTESGAAKSFGSDFMIDVMKSLDLDYVFSNPGSSFLGLHESITVYGGNSKPEFITCMHEESAAAMANGYYKAALKPAAIMCHGTVGLQHASMNLYNAWCDRVPLIAILGNTVDAADRMGATTWRHSAQDPVAMVRDFTKWDDQPASLQAFAESMVRGWKIATTPPMEPIALAVDSTLQEMEIGDGERPKIPRYTPSEPPQGARGAVRETAKLLVEAETPVIIVDRLARTPEGMRLLVELAELLNVPVIDIASRQNMPTNHYLNQTRQSGRLIPSADLILGLEVTDFWGQVNSVNRAEMTSEPRVKDGVKLITISVNDLYMKSNYQDFQRYAPVDISVSGDAEATLPALIEEVKEAMSRSRRRTLAEKEKIFRKMHADSFEESRQLAARGWDSSPVSTARMSMEIYEQIKDEDWALVSVGASERFISSWPHRLWNFDEHYRYLGIGAGGGVGYGLPAAVGAALANKKLGRFSVNIQCDGDFMYANGALWTAAHHRIPLLTVMHNNRAYAQESMLVQGTANRRKRGVERASIGTLIQDPNIDYAKLAEGMGVWSAGPIENPDDLRPALIEAVKVVKSGYPALVDVVTQMR